MPKYAQVLVDINKLGTKTFSYLIPDELKKDIKVGQAVAIPFGRRKENLKAYVVGFSDYLEDGIKAKNICEILDLQPMFSLEYLKLLEWVSSYYYCDIQTVLNTALYQKFFEKNVKKYRKPKIENKIFDLEKNFNKKHYNIAMTIDGKNYDSISFSKHIDTIFNTNSVITFIIGGSNGLEKSIVDKCDEKISFSNLTFPHGLFRGILLEQIYRAFKINNNERYHK